MLPELIKGIDETMSKPVGKNDGSIRPRAEGIIPTLRIRHARTEPLAVRSCRTYQLHG